MASDISDDEIFITQSRYSVYCNYDTDQLCDNILDMIDTKDTQQLPNIFSDISDDELDQVSTKAVQSMPLSTELSKPSSDVKQDRFHAPLDNGIIESLQKKQFAESTNSKLKWAVNLFKEWQKHRNTLSGKMDMSPILVSLEEMTKDELNFSISRFVCEVKKRNGDDYPSDTLYSLVVCLQLYMDSIGKQHKFMSDDSFIKIKNTLDNVMKSRARDHVKSSKKQAEIITLDEEDILWSKGVLGSEEPTQLLNTILYMFGLNFALRGGQEHRDLRFGPSSRITEGHNERGRYIMYTEDYSKTNQGGLQHRKVKSKSVIAYENTENPERCIINLYHKYIAHRPPAASASNAPFYLRPLANPKSDIWYSGQCIGRHKLANIVSTICKQAGLSGYRTNHSLRASAASRVYDAEVDEQLICEVTGHRSNAVRSYKRTNEVQKRELSNIIQGQDLKKLKSSKGVNETHTATCTDSNSNISVSVNISLNKR